MRHPHIPVLTVAVCMGMAVMVRTAVAAPLYQAFSLREASRQAEAGGTGNALLNMGNITRIAGMVYDRKRQDVILVGLVRKDLPACTLDDLTVALRARLRYDKFPLVSIDPDEETQKTKLQKVRFDGNLEDTRFGSDFLDCDVVLKRYSLQKLKDIPSVQPYTTRIGKDVCDKLGTLASGVDWTEAKETQDMIESNQGVTVSTSTSYQARFWFYVDEPYKADCKPSKSMPEVFCLNELKIRVKCENTLDQKNRVKNEDMPDQEVAENRNAVADLYSKDWSNNMDVMCEAFPVLKRLKIIYDLTAVADAITHLDKQTYLDYLLERHRIELVPTKRNWQLEERFGVVNRSDETRLLIRLSGGIDVSAELEFLENGDLTALRDIVIKSRPSENELTWQLPMDSWSMPNAKDLRNVGSTNEETSHQRGKASPPGCSVVCQSVVLNPKSTGGTPFTGFNTPSKPLPPLKGVSMRMEVSNSSYQQDSSGKLDRLRDEILKGRNGKSKPTLPGASGKP